MKHIVLNGSPKKENSVTLQSLKYLELKNPKDSFEYIHVIGDIKAYEKSADVMRDLCDLIQQADVVLWVFPVYHLLTPAHYKRFIELIFEYGFQSYFKGKYTAVFSTSVHFADNNAHEYMHGICDDLQMNYIDSLSHHMDDLPNPERQQDLLAFFDEIHMHVSEGLAVARQHTSLIKSEYEYIAGMAGLQVTTDKRIIVITDAPDGQNNVNEMVRQLDYAATGSIEVKNLRDVDIKGYCMGCCRCGYDNTCTYQDGYRAFLDDVINRGDIIIYAGEIKDRYLSSLFKLYHDRSFTYNHVPHFKGKQFGYMISGNLSGLYNLRQIIELYHQETSNLAGIISDEAEDGAAIDAAIYTLIRKAVSFSEKGFIKPATFLGMGLQSIFSNMIRGVNGAIFLADYRYYKKHGLLSNRIPFKECVRNGLMRYFMTKKAFRKTVHQNMFKHMLSAHEKTLRREMK
jgi:Multimeric flavodoxin WrbA